MATYLNKSFGANAYSKFRPTYPSSLFDYIKAYREKSSSGKPTKLTVDLACGTGQATQDLAKFSKRVVGIDHSEVMVNEARKFLPDSKFEFKVGTDADLNRILEPKSVDLLAVAEGAHWFSYPEFWNQAANVLAPGGTLAIFSYWTFSFPDYPVVSEIIDDYAYGKDKCGPYWDPGREILNNEYKHLRETIPESQFTDIVYRVNHFDAIRESEPFELVKKNVEVGGIVNMLKTWSSYFNYKKQNPDKPDIADGVMQQITEKTGLNESDEVTVKWNTVLLLATKKA